MTEAELTNRTSEARAYVLDRYRHSRHGSKYMPPSLEGSLFYGFGGGAEWGGNAADPSGILYLNANTMLWWLKMRDSRVTADGVALSQGGALFTANCAACHVIAGKTGGASQTMQAYPDLTDVDKRLTKEQIASLLSTGRGRMPSFSHLSAGDRDAIIRFLFKQDVKPSVAANDIHQSTGPVASAQGPDFPYKPPYLNNGNTQFRDQDNYPAIKPPWGTLNAINLNTGAYVWQVPLGEYPDLVKQGLEATGTENHGGPIVTAGGLLFIAATYDEKLRAFDTRNGKVVWEHKLPAGGFATPITYRVKDKQYIVIAAGGARYGLKSGGSYVAFALP